MSAWYNEIDPEKAAWIRELIRRGIVAAGDVDERSITDVRADDIKGYTQCHFFAGIAVWSYSLRLAGWPDDRPCWTGSCPCPSFSAAGKGEGFDDARHLWPAWWPLVRECRPAIVFGEQVAAAIRHGWWDLVSTDLESAGYAAAAAVLTSAGVGAPDIRERLYWVAESMHSERRALSFDRADGRDGQDGGRAEAHGEPGACSEVHRLADAEHSGRDRAGRTPPIADRDQPQDGLFVGDGSAGRLGYAGIPGLSERERVGRVQRTEMGPPARQAPERTSQPSRVAYSDGGESRLGELQRSGEHGQQPQDGRMFVQHFAADALKGHWGTADWLFCTDGKWRPVEAGTFPLADGSAFRLGRLRGYGDAINAEVAKAFIEAYQDSC